MVIKTRAGLKKAVGTRLPLEVYKALRDQAIKEGRSVEAIIRELVVKYLEEES